MFQKLEELLIRQQIFLQLAGDQLGFALEYHTLKKDILMMSHTILEHLALAVGTHIFTEQPYRLHQ